MMKQETRGRPSNRSAALREAGRAPRRLLGNFWARKMRKMNLSTEKELFSQKQGAEVKGYRVKGHYTFGARVQPEAAGLAGGLSPSSTCHLSWVLRSGWQQWSEDSQLLLGPPGSGWDRGPGLGAAEPRSGQEVHPSEEGATPRRPPLPLPSGTTRHAAAYHPCQPSPPGNVAAFSATPSGVPVAPRHTAAGGGGGSGAGAHPGARRKRQVPLPQRPWRSRWGRGLGKGGGRCSRAPGGAPGARASEGLEEAPPGQCQSVPPASSPSTAPARSSGPGGSPSCPSPTPQEETRLPSPVHPAREAPGEPCLAEARGWTPGSDPPAP